MVSTNSDRVWDIISEKSPKEFPLIFTSGRLVEYEGGGDETRSNPWLAELHQEMFVEINPITTLWQRTGQQGR